MSSSTSDWEPPSPEHLQQMLPQYEITGVLGRGGMGAVYEGRQAKLNRKVAIKVLPETFTRGEDELNFAKRFEQEAQAMAGLDHPAIISVYDFGETGEGQLYFVMEFVDGMDIHQYLHTHGGKLPQEQALAIVAHVLDALEYAHSHGIAHRDIKPANILLNREGRVKIADFGLAKKFGEAASDSVPALTMTNVAVGTPDFVAPEALDPDAKPDHRADLYAVGVMLYQMLTGRIPRGQFKAPSEVDAGLDPRLDAIVSRALQSDPNDRYPSAAAVRADLDTIFSQPFAKVEAGEDSAAVPVAVPVTDTVKRGGKAAPASSRGRATPAKAQPVSPPPASRGPLFLGIGVAAAAVLGLGAFFLFRSDEPAATTPFTGTAVTPPPIAETAKKAPPAPTAPDQPKKAAPPVADATTPPTKASPEPVARPAASTGTPSPLPAGQWTRIYSTIEDLPEPIRDPGSPRAVRMTDGWIAATRPAIQVTLPLPLTGEANYGVRATFRGVRDDDALTHGIVLRSQTADPRSRVYQLRRGQTTLHCQRREADQDWSITNAPTDPLPPKKEFTLEFCVIGDRLISRLDGGAFVMGRDGTYPKGDAFLYVNDMEVRDIEVIRLDGIPETEALTLLGVAADGSDLNAPQLTKSESPSAPASPPAPTVEDPVVSPLATLPGLKTRLEGFHNARRTQLGELAGKYLGGLESRLNQAANAGDLRLATAFEEEKTRVQTLQKSLANKPADPMAAVADPALTSLPELPGGSPDSLVGLRQAWTTESAKIRETLDLALRQSLQALEVELTRARDFENAKAVLAWREELEKPAARLVELVAGTNEAGAVAQSPTAPGSMTTATNSGGDAELAAATKEKPFENSLGMKFVPVPGTEVLFCIHETRWRDFEEFAQDQSGLSDAWKLQTFQGYEIRRDEKDHPVVSVNWVEANAFCDWLSKKEKKKYRLPTDREWSIAAGIASHEVWDATTTPETVAKPADLYLWGKEWPPAAAVGNFSDESRRKEIKDPSPNTTYINDYSDGFPTTSPVMSFAPNTFGLFDLSGNVWEWVSDWYSAEERERTVRGGSWNDGINGALYLSARKSNVPEHRYDARGFRIVLETGTPAATPASVTPATAPADATKNPFGWQPIPENPFPLPRPVRPTTPCRLVAWRLDGKPVDEAAFRQQFFGVPADMGEIVDLSANPVLSGKFTVPIALRADGSVVCLGGRFTGELPPDLPPAVMVAGGNDVAASLSEDGRVSMLYLSVSAKEMADAFEAVASWRDIVSLAASTTRTVYGIRADGTILASGKNDRKQCDIPEAFGSSVLKVVQNGPTAYLLRVEDRGLVVNRFGDGSTWTIPNRLDRDARVFLSDNVYSTNARGMIDYCNADKSYPASFANFRGSPTDIRDVSVTQSSRVEEPGIAALREGEDQWRFWGDRKELGGYDPKYCETKATGCWKLFFIGDYVLALKPVANLKPDDWMGTAAP